MATVVTGRSTLIPSRTSRGKSTSSVSILSTLLRKSPSTAEIVIESAFRTTEIRPTAIPLSSSEATVLVGPCGGRRWSMVVGGGRRVALCSTTFLNCPGPRRRAAKTVKKKTV